MKVATDVGVMHVMARVACVAVISVYFVYWAKQEK